MTTELVATQATRPEQVRCTWRFCVVGDVGVGRSASLSNEGCVCAKMRLIEIGRAKKALKSSKSIRHQRRRKDLKEVGHLSRRCKSPCAESIIRSTGVMPLGQANYKRKSVYTLPAQSVRYWPRYSSSSHHTRQRKALCVLGGRRVPSPDGSF